MTADLGEEAEHLSGDGLHVVLAAGDDERRDLVLASARDCAIVTWFCTQFIRSTIL